MIDTHLAHVGSLKRRVELLQQENAQLKAQLARLKPIVPGDSDRYLAVIAPRPAPQPRAKRAKRKPRRHALRKPR